jgi:alpha-ribazole phosphatase
MSLTRLLLIRHGESVLGRACRYAGHHDTPLTARGRAQASRLRRRLEKLPAAILFSSDLRRCRDTAALSAPGLPIRTSDRLRELDFGAWDGLSAETCRRRDPTRFDRWMRDPWTTRPPGGESLDQLLKRVREFVASAVRTFPSRTLVFVTHGGPIRALLARRRSDFWKARVPPGALVLLQWPAERRTQA